LNGRAGFVGRVFGLVVLARFFGETVVHGEFVDTQRITTVTITTSVAVDDDLRAQSDGNVAAVSQNVDSVSEGGGGSLSPA
jgi:hypothetical protein